MTSISRIVKPHTARIRYMKLRSRMRERKMKGKDLAEILGRSDTAVNRWLREGLPMPGDCIQTIAKIFYMSPGEIAEELLGFNVEPYEPTADEVLRALVAKIRETEEEEY